MSSRFRLISSSEEEKKYELMIKGERFELIVDTGGEIISLNSALKKEFSDKRISNIEFG